MAPAHSGSWSTYRTVKHARPIRKNAGRELTFAHARLSLLSPSAGLCHDRPRSVPPSGPVSGRDRRWTVVDLFSGAGGMSFGFHAHKNFRVASAVDAQKSKPSRKTLACNETYARNLGISPLDIDLQEIGAKELARAIRNDGHLRTPTILTACPPCTGFSRTLPKNHKEDDPRNSLVGRVAEFSAELRPKIVIVENARELLHGNFALHSKQLRDGLESLGYSVHAATYRLDRFGLAQRRERSIITAVAPGIQLKTLEDLWAGSKVNPKALTVRRAIWDLPEIAAGITHSSDEAHASSRVTPEVFERIKAIPRDGGSWISLFSHPDTEKLSTPAMRRSVAAGRTNHFSDVYGRMAWDSPAPVIKRECSHVGNGRYTHPEQDRLCTVRELAILQGFPNDYRFTDSSRQNAYRHVGDAVPPLISHQLAWLSSWMLTGRKPTPREFILDNTTLKPGDISMV
ncbi:DNA cytosine methyltransferase [Streptomyces poriferorum]|uniref:DNA cytosine methyltransferase n=1 Tax=Streptomyces poriferorum TaxID=2798799 RepID=UPI00273D6E19|nr:DNA cytosine methyltransferase [Streptomyces sp. Alt1]WLQ49924.1 DNA cytosine methyltransferase [Streptomyces sp. Alt1]